MNELDELLQQFRDLRYRVYTGMARGQDVTEDTERLRAMHQILVRKAIELCNLVVLQKDNYYIVAPDDERSRMFLYADGWKLIFPGDKEMSEEEITEHQRQALSRWNYFSQHLLAVNYIDEYLTFLTKNLQGEEQEQAMQSLVVEVRAVDLSEKHEEELDTKEKYVSENVSEKKKERRRKRETPL